MSQKLPEDMNLLEVRQATLDLSNELCAWLADNNRRITPMFFFKAFLFSDYTKRWAELTK